MPITLEDLESAALQLQPQDRGELIRRLLRTLESDPSRISQEEWIAAWADEADRRLQELDSGQVIPLDGPTVLRSWQERYP